MSPTPYNPEIHHRRSIRLKGHDYAGGGVYFVTLCAHREFIQWAGGKPFETTGAAKIPPEQPREGMVPASLIQAEMQKTARLLPWMEWGAWVMMPDHFHAIIKIDGGHGTLGDVMTGFKAGVTRTVRGRGDILVARNGAPPPKQMRIWHRNYYEVIVRSVEAERKIAEYIRMNPWRCVQDLGGGLRGMGNPALWNGEKLGVLCSRNAPQPKSIPNAPLFFSGFHSPMEKEILDRLLELKKPLIWCPAWGLERAALAPGVRETLEENRMLILEMRNLDGDLAAAEQRNRFILEHADHLWLPYDTPGGMVDRLVREMGAQRKQRKPQPTTEC